jgi:hypothetical protein
MRDLARSAWPQKSTRLTFPVIPIKIRYVAVLLPKKKGASLLPVKGTENQKPGKTNYE